MDSFKRRIEKVIQGSLAVLLALSLSLTPGAGLDEAQALPPIPPAAIFTVTAPPPLSDLPVGMYLINGVCPDPGSPIGPVCTLREAVDEANAMAAALMPPAYVMVNFSFAMPTEIYYGPIVIQSNVVVAGIPGGGTIISIPPHWVAPPPPLPPVTVPPPFDIFQMVGTDSEVFGTVILNQGFNEDAIQITGNRNLVDQNVLIGSNLAGVHVIGPSPANGLANTITGNLIGILPGDACAGNLYGILVEAGASTTTIDHNRISCNTNDGILLDSNLGTVQLTHIDTNTIGLDSTGAIAKPNGRNGIHDIKSLDTAIDDNLISGNSANGIRLTATAGTKVTRSYIGTDGTGNLAVPNITDGILIEDAGDDSGLSNNIEIHDDNLISGNGQFGVWVMGSFMDHVTIKGNIIGLNSSGNAMLPNLNIGVFISDTNNVTVGGPDPATDRNVISGNNGGGIGIQSASDILVDSNYIGLDLTGLIGLGNSVVGVDIYGSDCSNIIIGSLPPYSTIPNQYISGNGFSGIIIREAPGVVIGPKTFIGVGADGSIPLGNGMYGIWLNNVNGASIHSQIIAHNGAAGTYAGVAVSGNSSGVAIHPVEVLSTWTMRIDTNGGLPIDLNDDGPTPNDSGDGDTGPNTLLNYPVVTGRPSLTSISGTACANCEVHIYEAVGNPVENGGGGIYRAKVTADAFGNWTSEILPDSSRAEMIFVAYDPATGNTSEMSPRANFLYLPVIIRP